MPRDAPRLYLMPPPLTGTPAFASDLEAALAAGDVACVLLRPALTNKEAAETIRALIPLLQKQGVACLVPDDGDLALRLNADGVHIEGAGRELLTALRALQPGRIVGAGGLATRDAAMIAGEAGADYVMFGGPGDDEPQDSINAHVAWWAEIFNVPCVGFARDLTAIGDLVRAGADFIALSEAVFASPRGLAPAVAEASRLISQALATVP